MHKLMEDHCTSYLLSILPDSGINNIPIIETKKGGKKPLTMLKGWEYKNTIYLEDLE